MPGARILNHHAGLVNRMAETVGVDLSHSLAAGHLSGEDWHGMFMRCTQCADPVACQGWLATHQGETVVAAPAWCRNEAQMRRLQVTARDDADKDEVA